MVVLKRSEVILVAIHIVIGGADQEEGSQMKDPLNDVGVAIGDFG
jgi:hypothetical protein